MVNSVDLQKISLILRDLQTEVGTNARRQNYWVNFHPLPYAEISNLHKFKGRDSHKSNYQMLLKKKVGIACKATCSYLIQ